MSENRLDMLFTKRPCIGCIFYGACGDLLRTEECKERMTKNEYMKIGNDKEDK